MRDATARLPDPIVSAKAVSIIDELSRTKSDIPEDLRVGELFGALHSALSWASAKEAQRNRENALKERDRELARHHQQSSGCLTAMAVFVVIIGMIWFHHNVV